MEQAAERRGRAEAERATREAGLVDVRRRVTALADELRELTDSVHKDEVARAQQRLRRLFDAYGPERFFWGSDISRLPCTYRQAVTLFTEELAWLSAEDLALVMGQGLCDWLGWAAEA